MEPDRRRRAFWIVLLGAALTIYWLALVVATHLPLAKNDALPRWLDKLEHLLAFAGLAVLLLAAASHIWPAGLRLYASIFALIAIYGALDEWSQRLSPTRSPDIRDWLADLAGALLGIGLFALGRKLLATRPR